MKFLFPSFLFSLTLIVIPIIIHLFNFRKYKKLYFPNVKFLLEVQKQTQAKSQLKHLLVLIARILAIIFLVFAFSQPYIPVNDQKLDDSEKHISIYLDNSFSMEAVNPNGLLINEGKKRAIEILGAYKPNDRFQLLTNDFEGRHQRFVTKEEFISLLDEVKISPVHRKINEVITRQSDQLIASTYEKRIAYLLSDFQKNFVEEEIIKTDTSIALFLIPLYGSKNNNLYIDSIWFSNPVRQLNQSEELTVRIKNSSNTVFEDVPLKLSIDGLQKSPSSFSIDPYSSVEIKLNYTNKEAGRKSGLLKITDYPITYDDDFYFSYNVLSSYSTLIINQDKENQSLNSFFKKDSTFLTDNISEKSIDYARISTYNQIILNELKEISSGLAQELKRFVENGGSLCVFPSNEPDLANYKEFLTALKVDHFTSLDTVSLKLATLNLDHPIFKNVFSKPPSNIDLPLSQKHFTLSRNENNTGEKIISFQNGESFLSQFNVARGKIYLFSSPLHSEFTNFHKHALFVPVMYNIGILSEPTDKLFYTIGTDKSIDLGKNHLTGESSYHLIDSTQQFDFIPQHLVNEGKSVIQLQNLMNLAGNYHLTDGSKIIKNLSFNYDRSESELKYSSENELKKLFSSNNIHLINATEKPLTDSIQELNMGIRFWKLCIIFALLFIGIESLLIRFLK